MAQATFLVHLIVDDVSPSVLLDLAAELEDDLTKAGHDVESVAPWTRPTGGLVPDAQSGAWQPNVAPTTVQPAPPVVIPPAFDLGADPNNPPTLL